MSKPGGYKHSTSSEIVKSGPGVLYEVMLSPAAALCTLTVYDNTAASGDIICAMQGVANGESRSFHPHGGVAFSKGVYVELSGAGATVSTAFR
jgi:hypothetical protein